MSIKVMDWDRPIDFSVLISVYSKERSEFLHASLESIIEQTVQPTEIVIVKDGPLTKDLDDVILSFIKQHESLFKIVTLEKNEGLGVALSKGLEKCSYNIVARMDSDDISVPSRFENQLRYLNEHPEIDVLGSVIQEFKIHPNDGSHIRVVPENHQKIVKTLSVRNPMNHMTVIFKLDKVLKSGGYLNAPFFEDYFLWARMINDGAKFHNIQIPLVKVRVGNDMIGKRHGIKYAKFELNHFNTMLRLNLISKTQYIKAISIRLPCRILPKSLLSALYNLILRTS